MVSQSSLYPSSAVFTVGLEYAPSEPVEKIDPGRSAKPPNDQTFDLAVVEFNDDGSLVDPAQRSEAVDCISAARESNPNGALVVVFIHGWHHSARPDDKHFAEFRRILMSLTLREAERYHPEPSGRRVVGIYLAWQGDPPSGFAALNDTWLTHLSFFGRYRTAKKIGDGNAFGMTIKEIVERTKGPPPSAMPQQPESPLTFLGHSMGALMLESAFLALLRHGDTALAPASASSTAKCVQVKHLGTPVSFPDAVIAINSAADSRITRAIVEELGARNLSKSASSNGISFSPPLFVSATATHDWATRLIWRFAPFNFFRKTGGHDKTLLTHALNRSEADVICLRKSAPDFGQGWSCLRPPEPAGVASPKISIDLPEREPSLTNGDPNFKRYRLAPLGDQEQAHRAWIFQLPPSVSKEHNDIFNLRLSLFILSLMQISGAVASLAEDWQDNFEPLPD